MLLIGGGVSSVDIAREISPVVQTVYQSTRNGAFDVPASALPKNATRIEQVALFEINSTDTASPETHLPLDVRLKSGQTLNNIDRIILCTGYQMVLPFLPEYTDHGEPIASPDSVIVTDGTQFHNLHRDIFYIPDPTLAFVGVPFYTATFTLFEFQAIAVAAVFSGVAQLPSVESMRTEYKTRVETKGHGRSSHSLKGEEVDYVKQIIAWVNTGRFAHGLPLIEGHTASWLDEKKVHVERLMLIWQGAIPYGNTAEAASRVEVSA